MIILHSMIVVSDFRKLYWFKICYETMLIQV